MKIPRVQAELFPGSHTIHRNPRSKRKHINHSYGSRWRPGQGKWKQLCVSCPFVDRLGEGNRPFCHPADSGRAGGHRLAERPWFSDEADRTRLKTAWLWRGPGQHQVSAVESQVEGWPPHSAVRGCGWGGGTWLERAVGDKQVPEIS